MKIKSLLIILLMLITAFTAVSCGRTFGRGGVEPGSETDGNVITEEIITAPSGIWFSPDSMIALAFEKDNYVTKYTMDGPIYYKEFFKGSYEIESGKITFRFPQNESETYSYILDGRNLLILIRGETQYIFTPLNTEPQSK